MGRRISRMSARARHGQAMIETVLAVTFLSVLFFTMVQLAQMVQARILLDHAAARASRARAVGFNEFMCLKSARVAMIPVSGKQLLPLASDMDEAARVPIYLSSESEAHARGILDYERWHSTFIDMTTSGGLGGSVQTRILMDADDYRMDGFADVETHYPLYMFDQGR